MKSSTQEITTILGTAMGGGLYAGRILIKGDPFALIISPKALGEHKPTLWIPKYKAVPGALHYDDGRANTLAMADAGSKLAQWALELHIDDQDDWYLPAQDELEILYRNLKPTGRENTGWNRSGINLSAIEPTRPYTPLHPVQTSAEAFQSGSSEAFEEDVYWSSTQHASDSVCAWCQVFGSGGQSDYGTLNELRARAVRRLPL